MREAAKLQRKMLRLVRLSFTTAACLYLGCGDPTQALQTQPPVAVVVSSGDEQVRFPGALLPERIVIQLVDASGMQSHTSGLRVTWSVIEGGGEVGRETDTTDTFGRALTNWRLGPLEGPNRAEANVEELSPIVFTADAVPPGPIAFVSNRRTRIPSDPFEGTPADVFVMNEDGSNVTQLSPEFTRLDWLEGPAWSADGRSIAYVKFFRSTLGGIVVNSAIGEDERAIPLPDVVLETHYANPAWSPDGKRIAMHHPVSGFLFLMRSSTGSDVTQLTTRSGRSPDWSPDGETILFACGTAICVVKVDGTGLTTLTSGSDPVWPPDGTRILIARDPESSGGVWVMNADGTGQLQVIEGNASSPSWSPDGAAFVTSIIDGSQQDIFRVDVATGAAVNLTNGNSRNWDPTWKW